MPAYFAASCRGKESVALDLKSEEGSQRLENLLAQADVLVENYRPGVLEKLGFGWERLHQAYPRLIVCSISGYGQGGPYDNRPAMDTIAQAMSGLMSVTGFPDQEPHGYGANSGDVITGIHATVGIQAALLSRVTDGEGRYIDIAMVDCNLVLMSHFLSTYADTGEHAPRAGGSYYRTAPFGIFKCGDGSFMAIVAFNGKDFPLLCGILGTEHLLEDPRFKAGPAGLGWREHDVLGSSTVYFEEFRAELERALAQKPRDEWLELLRAAELGCSPVNTIEEVLHDPQLRHRKMICTMPDAGHDGKHFTVIGNPIKISGFEDSNVRHAVAAHNQHASNAML